MLILSAALCLLSLCFGITTFGNERASDFAALRLQISAMKQEVYFNGRRIPLKEEMT